jgi:hypothetical protein
MANTFTSLRVHLVGSFGRVPDVFHTGKAKKVRTGRTRNLISQAAQQSAIGTL